MGINLGWIAVESRLKEDLLERLGLEPTGDAVHEVGQAYALADTPEGWTVVTFGKPASDMDKTVAKAAPEGSSVCGFISETVMASEVRGYEDGQFLWSVERYAHKGPGLMVQGEPPKVLANIQSRREAEQAGPDSEGVDFLFEAPRDLGEALTGYRPGENELEWQILGRKKQSKTKGTPKAHRSLSSAIKTELVPLFLSLGWRVTNDNPNLAWTDQIVRQIGEEAQTVSLNFASGDETYGTYITISFYTRRPLTADSEWCVGGVTHGPTVPIFNRFPWGFAKRKPELDDPIQAAIDKAKIEILAIDAFLKGGEQPSCVAHMAAGEHPPKPVEPPPPTVGSRIRDFLLSQPLRRRGR